MATPRRDFRREESLIPVGYRFVGRVTIPCKAISKSNDKSRWLPIKYEVFEDMVAALAWNKIGATKISKGWVTLQCYFKDRKHSDLNNLCKSIFDGLVKGKVLKDDKYIAVTVFPAIYGKEDKFTLEVWEG